MSLKTFHIFFIVTAIIFSLGFALWCFQAGANDGAVGVQVMGVFSAGIAVTLYVYARWFLRKLNGL